LGFTLLELLTTMAIIAILAALLLPALQQGYARAKRVACGSNLKSVGTAFHTWAHDHNDLFPMQVLTNAGGTREFAEAARLNPNTSFTFRHFQALSNVLMLPKPLACPVDRQRAAASDFAVLGNENVSYWINTAAAFGRTDSPIAGDRNVRTSGRIEWTFIQFGPTDVVEFSAELHGYRGNVLFGDAHVEVLDAVSLRRAFASSNAPDVTLSIPRPEVARTGPNNNSERGGNGGAGNSVATPSASPANSPDSSGPDASKGNQPFSKSNEVSSADPINRGRLGSSAGDITQILVTRLDGSIVTSSVPRTVTNSLAGDGNRPANEREATNPLIAFAQWLVQISARGTYWLLFLLLLALVAFEVARRRAQRKRRGKAEESDY
jgi:prepilin-type N-terminal cleavage/methylation domain-containing protein/prepilin-type processing-associated H-X9-DG protein